MLKLTRLNGQESYINPESVKYVEKAGDTRITFMDDTMLIVREDPETIKKLFIEYKLLLRDQWKEKIHD